MQSRAPSSPPAGKRTVSGRDSPDMRMARPLRLFIHRAGGFRSAHAVRKSHGRHESSSEHPGRARRLASPVRRRVVYRAVRTTDDYPGLVGRLFVLNHVADGDYSFRRVGYSLERLFGRQLTEHNFLSIWNEPDRQLVSAALCTATPDRGPALIRARGETLTGRRVDLEFALAPLLGRSGAPNPLPGRLPDDDAGGHAWRPAPSPPAGCGRLSARSPRTARP